MTNRILTCVDWDDSTESCLDSAWVEASGMFFDLPSYDEVAVILGLIAGLWVVAYLMKVAIRQVRYS